jgi:hypothetical protein
MSQENIRIRTSVDEIQQNIKVQINQKFDFIEILSLKISQEEAYRRFSSDYGAVVGRVTVKNGFGVPNAKVSIFIPISLEDKLNPEIFGLYPFEITTNKDSDGIPYNLLPNSSDGKDSCFSVVGSFPSKRQVQDNPEMTEIFCNYYKFTTTTNESGDFMIFGVPIGAHLLHVDADISDIGIISQKPYDLIRDGATETSFDSANKFKSRERTPNPVQLKTVSPVGINVIPFWGDTEQFEIGITRVDVDLKTDIVPSAIFMGSIISDNEKNSLNKNCRPRTDMGNLNDLVTGPGRIEMIRYNSIGGIERFDVNGGNVIDDNGIWAYQVPMNLDYVITSEDVRLIPSNDPSRGIPTRARVRFRVSMDTTGSESRLRTRAKFLIPHNPDNWNDSDYSFDTTTRDKHFVDFHWNKIYTVKNLITRTQRNTSVENRNFTGLKNLNDVTSFNPFPFNRLDNSFNPIFSLLCLILSIFSGLVCLINRVLIPLINVVLILINGILKIICKIVFAIGKAVCKLKLDNNDSCKSGYCIGTYSGGNCSCNEVVPYIRYITLACSEEPDGKPFAICGYKSGALDGGKAWEATKKEFGTAFYYPEKPGSGAQSGTPGAGWLECVTISLAAALIVFRFDFYNDWINGTLYSFLLKYKIRKKGKGKERFCEIDCEDDENGTDNNDDGSSDNNCNNITIIDSCTALTGDVGVNSKETSTKSEGLIKKYDNELYYATHSKKSGYKLFATDIVSLGSSVDCHWLGEPKFYQYLNETSYNMPPFVAETDEDGTLEVSGYGNKIGSQTLIGNLTCLGLSTNPTNCLNIKRLSEYGVGLDEDRREDGLNAADAKIDNKDVDNPFIRGMFAYANDTSITTLSEMKFDSNYDTFRGLSTNLIKQPKNSLYFYFGLNSGKTALTKLINKYFYPCERELKQELFLIAVEIIEDDFNPEPTGGIIIDIIGGVGPYQIKWSGPIINGLEYTSNEQNIFNLYSGTYNIRVIDANGNIVNGTFIVPGPPSISCDVQVKNTTKNGLSDGEIIISITNGTAPYNIIICDYDTNNRTCNNILTDVETSSNTFVKNGLPIGSYEVKVIDSGIPQTQCRNIVKIIEPTPISIELTPDSWTATTNNAVYNLSCFNSNDGAITSRIYGGVKPYTIKWYNGTTELTDDLNKTRIKNKSIGTYKIIVTDSVNQISEQSITLNQPPEITVQLVSRRGVGCRAGASEDYNYTYNKGETTNYFDSTECEDDPQSSLASPTYPCGNLGRIRFIITKGVGPFKVYVEGGYFDKSETLGTYNLNQEVNFDYRHFGRVPEGNGYEFIITDLGTESECEKIVKYDIDRPGNNEQLNSNSTRYYFTSTDIVVYVNGPSGGYSGRKYQFWRKKNETTPTQTSSGTGDAAIGSVTGSLEGEGPEGSINGWILHTTSNSPTITVPKTEDYNDVSWKVRVSTNASTTESCLIWYWSTGFITFKVE